QGQPLLAGVRKSHCPVTQLMTASRIADCTGRHIELSLPGSSPVDSVQDVCELAPDFGFLIDPCEGWCLLKIGAIERDAAGACRYVAQSANSVAQCGLCGLALVGRENLRQHA